jgi:hypothetical protein
MKCGIFRWLINLFIHFGINRMQGFPFPLAPTKNSGICHLAPPPRKKVKKYKNLPDTDQMAKKRGE